VLENRVLGRILVPKRNEVKGYWRNLRNDLHHNFNFSPHVISVMKGTLMKVERHGVVTNE
jgi:hypothetical protein